MYKYVYMCIDILIYVYIYLHICTHICVHVFRDVYTCTCAFHTYPHECMSMIKSKCICTSSLMWWPPTMDGSQQPFFVFRPFRRWYLPWTPLQAGPPLRCASSRLVLRSRGAIPVIFDKGKKSVGGRFGSHQRKDSAVDLGAQFMRVSDDNSQFAQAVRILVERQLVF